jgi:hypothetical protein
MFAIETYNFKNRINILLISIQVYFIPFHIDMVSHGGFMISVPSHQGGLHVYSQIKRTPCNTVDQVFHGPFHTLEFPLWLAEYSWTVYHPFETY